MNPLPIILNSDYNIIKTSKEVRLLIKEAMKEGISVAHRLGIKLYFDPREIARKIQLGKLDNFKYKGSMYYDIVNGKKTEIEFITGEVVKKASQLGIKTPVLQTVYLMAKILEKASSFSKSK